MLYSAGLSFQFFSYFSGNGILNQVHQSLYKRMRRPSVCASWNVELGGRRWSAVPKQLKSLTYFLKFCPSSANEPWAIHHGTIWYLTVAGVAWYGEGKKEVF
jgi:hypothetical protein